MPTISPRTLISATILLLCIARPGFAVTLRSPDGQNFISLQDARESRGGLELVIGRDKLTVIAASSLGPTLAKVGSFTEGSTIVDAQQGKNYEKFDLPWGKTKSVVNRCATSIITLMSPSKVRWQIELRAYDDGVAFRYRLLPQDGAKEFEIADEATQFRLAGEPTVLFDTLKNFTTSHEALYERKPLSELPAKTLMDMPVLFVWPKGLAAAITEARVRSFAGGYLERAANENRAVRWRLSPHPQHKGVCAVGTPPIESPWRVVLLGNSAGKLLESNLLICLNDPPRGDFSWARPGKTSFHWWYGEFEDDYKLADEADVYLARHKRYIDFCAQNKLAYHSVSGDGLSWYVQSKTGYGTPMPDADVRRARPELKLPEIIEYARKRGVGIRLWVHWKPLAEHLEDAFALYESWGIKGLMVDFLDRDDQEMVEWTEHMLESAARHKLHIQIHGSSKYSGEQRSWPNLFNREGVLNLEYLKWSDLCTPAHSVNVAYTRALAGPVDFHLGGFRAVSRQDFKPRDRAPVIMGTRCNQLALYVVYENPMPMVADAPRSYEGQTGFEFIERVPTTWDETRFLAGEPGEYIVIGRRKGSDWYLAGITNWTPREIDVPLDALAHGNFTGELYTDGSMDESKPNAINKQPPKLNSSKPLHVSMAPGGGFVAVLHAN